MRKDQPNNHLNRRYLAAILCLAAVFMFSPVALAADTCGGDPLQVVSNLTEFMFSAIRAIGIILLGFGIVQIGLSMKSHDPSQRANGFLTLFGGVVITFTKEILNLIIGG